MRLDASVLKRRVQGFYDKAFAAIDGKAGKRMPNIIGSNHA